MSELERLLSQAASRPQLFGSGTAPTGDDAIALEENLLTIHAELDAEREPRLARLLRRLGVSDLTVPLVTATPALRRSWFVAIAIAVVFALSAATNNQGTGVDRITVYLTMAPLLPLLGVALAFGRGVDPTHELVVAAPTDTFKVFLVRATTVLVASSTILLLCSLLLPDAGAYRVAWLLPALAITAASLALSAHFAPRRVATMLAVTWLALVIVVTSAASVTAMFGSVTQLASVAVAAAGTWYVYAGRERFEQLGSE